MTTGPAYFYHKNAVIPNNQTTKDPRNSIEHGTNMNGKVTTGHDHDVATFPHLPTSSAELY